MSGIQENSDYVYFIEKHRYTYRWMTCSEYAVRRYTYKSGKVYLPSGITLKKGSQKECLSFCKKNHIEPRTEMKD